MSLLLLFQQNVISASLAVTEDGDALTSNATVLVSTIAAINEAVDAVAANSAVLVKTAASITETDDTVACTSTVLVTAAASITEGDDTFANSGVDVVATTAEPAHGGYLSLVRAKPKRKPLDKPKPLPKRTAVVAVNEQRDSVSAAATVDSIALEAGAALVLAAEQAERKRRVIEHNNDFLMVA